MPALLDPLRLTLRRLRRAPAFTAVTVLSLALGIGAAATMFSVVDAVDFRPLPFPDAHRLVLLHETAPAGSPACGPVLGCMSGTSTQTAADWRAQSRTLAAVGVLGYHPRRLWHGDEREPLRTADVSPDLFTVLGTRPSLGRPLIPADAAPGSEPVIVLGDALWRGRFGATPGIVGTRVRLDDPMTEREETFTVVGVMPPGFGVLSTQAWTPLRAEGVFAPTHRDRRLVVALGRLAPGRTVTDADVEARTLASRFAAAYPATNAGWSAGAVPFRGTLEVKLNQLGGVGGAAGLSRFLLLGVVGLVLLVAALNVAILASVRAGARAQELAVRGALGASGARLARGLLAESLCLCAGGGVLGVMLAVAGTRVVARGLLLDGVGIPITVDGRVLLFALGLTGATTLVTGTLPALCALRRAAAGALRVHTAAALGPAGRDWGRGALATAEMAGALVLLTAAGLLGRELLRLRFTAPGFDPSHLYAIDLAPPERGPQTLPAQWRFADAASARLAAATGATTVALQANDVVPVVDVTAGIPRTALPSLARTRVSAGFFEALRVPVLRGRTFTAEDRWGTAPVVVVDATAAAALWPGRDPVGERVTFNDSTTGTSLATVIGVVGAVRYASPLASTLVLPAVPNVYRPLAQASAPRSRFALTAFVRSTQPAGRLLPALRRTTRDLTGASVDPGAVRSEEARLTGELQQQRFSAAALGAFAAFGLGLAALGLYGVVASGVASRTREIAVRVALGATPRDVLRRVTGQGLALGVVGMVGGLAGSLALARVFQAVLVGTAPFDPAVFVGSAVVLAAVAGLACVVPARRAARVEPATALRSD